MGSKVVELHSKIYNPPYKMKALNDFIVQKLLKLGDRLINEIAISAKLIRIRCFKSIYDEQVFPRKCDTDRSSLGIVDKRRYSLLLKRLSSPIRNVTFNNR